MGDKFTDFTNEATIYGAMRKNRRMAADDTFVC